MRGRPTKGYRRSDKVAAIEAEFDLTFPEVIAGFVQDGYNRSQVASILGFDRATFHRKLKGLQAAGVTFNWPDPYASRDQIPQERTPARVRATTANLQRAHAGNAAYWETNRRGTQELAAKAVELRQQGLPWLTVASRLGVDVGTLRRARTKYQTPDSLGNKLKRAAQRKFSGSKEV